MILRVDHLVLAVRQIEEAAGAWERTLGLASEPPYRPEGTSLELALLRLGDDSAFLELVRPLTDTHRVARHLAERGEGMFSVSLRVDDLDATVERLRSKGLPVSDPEPGVFPGTRVARVPRAQAHGVAIQLIERAG